MSNSVSPASVLSSAGLSSVPMSNSVGFALKVAREWQQVPDDVTDEDAIQRGFITPEMLILILQIVQDMMQNCFSNKPAVSLRRVKNYLATKEMDRISDTIRVNWLIDRWVSRLGIARDRGDVTEINRSLTKVANGMTEDEFKNIQTEMLFMTV